MLLVRDVSFIIFMKAHRTLYWTALQEQHSSEWWQPRQKCWECCVMTPNKHCHLICCMAVEFIIVDMNRWVNIVDRFVLIPESTCTLKCMTDRRVNVTFMWPCIIIHFFTIKPTDALISKFILVRNSTCFGQFLCPSSGVLHRTFGTGACYTGLMTTSMQDQDGTEFHLVVKPV
jgi:hypothetical protein